MVKFDLNEFDGKTILVTGGTGSIGSEIVKRLFRNTKAKSIRVYSRDEFKQFNMQHELKNDEHRLRFLVGDVRDKDRLNMAMEGVDIVFHAAALKHVPSCEFNPFEAIKTNVLGAQNVVETALANDVEKVIAISTDKAVNPVNTMGATKLLAEKLIISANYYKGDKPTKFSCVRFGNVLASRGSVVPLFIEQIKKGGPVTLTDEHMTRFIMSARDAVDLIFKSSSVAVGGEVFILKMPVVKVKDLLEVLIEEVSPENASLEIKTIGARAGEKMYEELMTGEEAAISYELDDLFVIPAINSLEVVPSIYSEITSYIKSLGGSKCTLKRYSSEDSAPVSKEEIKKILKSEEII